MHTHQCKQKIRIYERHLHHSFMYETSNGEPAVKFGACPTLRLSSLNIRSQEHEESADLPRVDEDKFIYVNECLASKKTENNESEPLALDTWSTPTFNQDSFKKRDIMQYEAFLKRKIDQERKEAMQDFPWLENHFPSLSYQWILHHREEHTTV